MSKTNTQNYLNFTTIYIYISHFVYLFALGAIYWPQTVSFSYSINTWMSVFCKVCPTTKTKNGTRHKAARNRLHGMTCSTCCFFCFFLKRHAHPLKVSQNQAKQHLGAASRVTIVFTTKKEKTHKKGKGKKNLKWEWQAIIKNNYNPFS